MFSKFIVTGLVSFLTYDFFKNEYDYPIISAIGMACCTALLLVIAFWSIGDFKKWHEEKRWQKRRKAIDPSFYVEKDDLNVKNEYDFLFNKN